MMNQDWCPLLVLKKQCEISRLKSVVDDPEVWITELEDICNQIDEIGLTSFMSDDDIMLYVMCNLPEEYDMVPTDLENRLMAESIEKLTIELMHQKSNTCFKRLQSKK